MQLGGNTKGKNKRTEIKTEKKWDKIFQGGLCSTIAKVARITLSLFNSRQMWRAAVGYKLNLNFFFKLEMKAVCTKSCPKPLQHIHTQTIGMYKYQGKAMMLLYLEDTVYEWVTWRFRVNGCLGWALLAPPYNLLSYLDFTCGLLIGSYICRRHTVHTPCHPRIQKSCGDRLTGQKTLNM